MRKIVIIVISVSIFLFACSPKKDRIISINDMKLLVWDMMNAENYYSYMTMSDTNFFKKKKNFELYNQVFIKHDVSKEQFYNSYTYYEKNPDEMKILFDSLDVYGNRMKTEFDNKINKKINNKK